MEIARLLLEGGAQANMAYKVGVFPYHYNVYLCGVLSWYMRVGCVMCGWGDAY